MDLGSLYWVGDNYQKVESFRVEEETVYQDTVKYVEEQMHTFGASVKKLCSEVMQDLLPQSILNIVLDENRLSSEAYQADIAIEQQCPNKDAEKYLDNRKDSECIFPSNTGNLVPFVTEYSPEEFTHNEVYNGSNEQPHAHVDPSLNSGSRLDGKHNQKDGVKITAEMSVDNGDLVINASETTTSTTGKISSRFNGTSNTVPACENQSYDDHIEVLQSKLDKMKLGDSCVLVENCEHPLTMPFEHKQKPYKKKIMDVFSPRRWSKGKQVEERHLQFEELNEEDLVPSSQRYASCKVSELSKFPESDWELV